MSHRTHRLLAAAAALVALAAAAPAQADPLDDVNHAVAKAAADVDQAVGGIGDPIVVNPGGIIRDGGPGGIGGGGGFPPMGFAVTAVTWSMGPGQTTPSFTPPNPLTSHPANWSCSTSTTLTTAHATCTPTDPPDPGTSGWACYDPYVVADVSSPLGAAGDSITGNAHCGASSAVCTASTSLGTPTGHCSNWSFVQVPTPLECEADFGQAKPTATWTVRCAPIDP